MKSIKIQRTDAEVLGGHLIENTTLGKYYTLYYSNKHLYQSRYKFIIDDIGERIHVSNTILNKFFTMNHRS